ncbi:flagellar basal-body rod protein FlgB [Nocardioides psychrotolerans]|uniref:Flagellar basal body rod protein FlgB n=1 Tax=Nocardioides psychrotolerans TaxID=1005945 RepID=A0A1I3Q3D7_9ACTN|nr:flagellar basal body protein [Nocardioides psychrotolerans]GEP40205.1 flagellar basal-body rod protein FlgB [Nocardioides psychrotolerans]SFJ28724.1 flagellar basal-body rod protein FlgB [Nocardioides psychrotolerans]
MSVPAFSASDAVSSVLGAALDGLSMRQRVIADNIANIDTPGFRATSVDFESSLRSAITSGDPSQVGVATTPTDTPVGPDGNSVDLRKETVAAMQSQFQYQMMTRAVSDRFDILRISAGA